jgi:acetyl-CoA C-acetyltransferase
LRPTPFDQVILGCVNVIADEMNPARVARCGSAWARGWSPSPCRSIAEAACSRSTPATATSARAPANLILAGGAEALSHAPLVWPQSGVRWFAGLASAKGVGAKIMAALKCRPSYLKPIIGLERGLTDPITELNMGRPPRSSAISSASPASSRTPTPPRATAARPCAGEGFLKGEVETAFSRDGKFYDHDDGVRPDSTPRRWQS